MSFFFVFLLEIRPYSNDMGFEDLDVSAFLSVKYVVFNFFSVFFFFFCFPFS